VSSLGRLIFGHWPLKLMALLLATLLYAGLALSDSTRSFVGPVPIEVLNAPTGGALLDHPGVVDSIEFRAPAELADALTNDSFRASIDLSNVQPRAGAEPVEVPVDVFPVDPRVRVVDYSPVGVTVRVDEVVSRTLPVIVDHGPLPEGIEVGPIITEPNQVTISGASSRLQNVRTVEGRFVVDASGINIDEDVRVDAFDDVGAIVPGIDIEPLNVRVRADVARQLAYTTLPVIPELVGEPARGRRVDNVSVLPAAVTVSGENPDLRRLEAVHTQPIDVSGQSIELVTEVPLIFPEEVTSPGEQMVTVIVTFTDATASRTYEVGTALVGAQAGYSYSVAEPSVSVVISGSVAQLDDLEAAELIVEVPVDDLQVGDNDVMPSVETPRGTSIVSLSPDTVRVTVERAS
jgi:YbbR domain-containing protein